MLPVALTCPVWWVARWTARMLTSLAVVLACSLGAAATPGGAASPAWAAPAAGAVASVSGEWADLASRAPWLAAATPAGFGTALAPTRSAVASSDGAGRAVPGSAGANPALIARTAGSAEADVVAVDRPVASAGSFVPAMPPRAVVVPAGRQRPLVGLTPATLGSRAPPVR